MRRFWHKLFFAGCAIAATSVVASVDIVHADNEPGSPDPSSIAVERLKLQLEQRSSFSEVPSQRPLSASKPAGRFPVLLLLGGGGTGVVALVIKQRISRKQSQLFWQEQPSVMAVDNLSPEEALGLQTDVAVEDQTPIPEAVLGLPSLFSLDEGLELLNSNDIEGWNQWRDRHPDHPVSLTKIDLAGKPLFGINFSRVDLSKACLERADLSHANLSYANLQSARMQGCDLTGANLSYADFRRSSLQGADLSFANLSYATLNEANLVSAQLKSANCSHARLINANLSHAFAKWAILQSTVLQQAIAQRTNFEVAQLTNVNLERADLSHADFRHALLYGAKVQGTNFTHADFLGSHVEDWQYDQWTNFSGTVLEEELTTSSQPGQLVLSLPQKEYPHVPTS